MKILVLSVLLSFFLICCTSEPSQSDIQFALSESIKSDVDHTVKRKLFGISILKAFGLEDVVINSVEKIGCEPSGRNAYVWEVVVDITYKGTEGSLFELLGGPSQHKNVSKYRFVKTSEKWIVVDGEKLSLAY